MGRAAVEVHEFGDVSNCPKQFGVVWILFHSHIDVVVDGDEEEITVSSSC